MERTTRHGAFTALGEGVSIQDGTKYSVCQKMENTEANLLSVNEIIDVSLKQ